MFKTWDLFFDSMVLLNLSNVCQLPEYVSKKKIPLIINGIQNCIKNGANSNSHIIYIQYINKLLQEKRLLTEEDKMKVEKFRREFEPKNLPDDVYQSGRYVTGNGTNMPGGFGFFGGAFNNTGMNMQFGA